MTTPLLAIDNLSISYATGEARIHALRQASLMANKGEVIGIVGESGCGKSTLVSAIINLLAANAEVNSGEVRVNGKDILKLSVEEKRAVRGGEIAMVFQDPMTSFNPVLTIGDQLTDFQHRFKQCTTKEKTAQAEAMLAHVGIANPDLCLGRFPHELSGGMRQRVAIAAALLMQPSIFLADEPTTALDVTMEAQIIHLLRELRNELDGAIIVVTHHLGVVAELCDRVYVMYAGQIVEQALVDDLFHAPRHPYTKALIACDPAHIHDTTSRLPTIPGRVPNLASPPPGCSFFARCTVAKEHCKSTTPPWVEASSTQAALCHEVKP